MIQRLEFKEDVLLRMNVTFSGFLSEIEPKKVEEALEDPDWVIAMQEKLNQFERQKVWKLVPKPKEQVYNWHQVGIQK